MFHEVVEQIAAVIEQMPVDDSSITDGLRYDPRGETIGADMTVAMFRYFVFQLPISCTPDWHHENAPVTPSMWNMSLPMVVFYPVGDIRNNLEPVIGMALDDATRMAHHLAVNAVTYFNSHMIDNFQLSGVRTTHDALELEGADGLVSTFTLNLRFYRDYE